MARTGADQLRITIIERIGSSVMTFYGQLAGSYYVYACN